MLQRVTLQLARCRDFPDGSTERGYELVAPIDSTGHLDFEEWGRLKAQCHVKRIWAGEADRYGALVHHGGPQGGAWAIHYGAGDASDEEKGVRLSSHRFVKDEYVSVQGDGGDIHAFKIVGLKPLNAARAG